MNDKVIGQMSEEEFNALIERFIETQSDKDDPLPGEVFFDLWAEIEAAREPIAIKGMVVEGKLVFLPPVGTSAPLIVHDNEIAVGGHIVRVELVPA